jgi:hypothetical protein
VASPGTTQGGGKRFGGWVGRDGEGGDSWKPGRPAGLLRLKIFKVCQVSKASQPRHLTRSLCAASSRHGARRMQWCQAGKTPPRVSAFLKREVGSTDLAGCNSFLVLCLSRHSGPIPRSWTGAPLQGFNVRQVLGATARLLVAEEGFSSKKRHPEVHHLLQNSRRPCLFEAHSTDLGQDIDAPGRESDLVDDSWPREILDRQPHGFHGGSEANECSPDPRGILGGGLEPEIKISRRPDMPMNSQRMGADNEKEGSFFLEKSQDVLKVAVQRGSP